MLDLFKKKKATKEELIAGFQQMKLDAAAAKEKLADARIGALSGRTGRKDIEDASFALSQAQLGRQEIRRRLTELIEEDNRAEFEKIPVRKKELDGALQRVAGEAGATLARSIRLMGQFSETPLREIMRKAMDAYSEHQLQASKASLSQTAFERGFTDEMNEPMPGKRDFGAEKRCLESSQAKAPGTAAALNHVRHTVAKLLDPDATSHKIKPAFDS